MFHFPWPKRAEPSLVDKLCEQAVALVVQQHVIEQQKMELRLRPHRQRRKDSAEYIEAYITTHGRLRRELGWE